MLIKCELTFQLLFVLSALFVANGELVDMSFPYENNMPTWPNIKMLPYKITLNYEGPFFKAPYIISFDIELNEQTGTHQYRCTSTLWQKTADS